MPALTTVQIIYIVQMKKIYYESTSMSIPTPFSKNTMLHQRIERRLIRNDGCLADWLADE
jgi:hypothetical protein